MTNRKDCPECNRLNIYYNFIEHVKETEYKVLTDISCYYNTSTKLEILCPKGHIFNMNIHSFKSGKRCKFCKSEKLSKDRRLSKEELIKRYKLRGYEIIDGLDEYRNEKDYLLVKCPNGHIYSGMVSVFNHGHGCQQCFDETRGQWMKGEDHPNWKGGITSFVNILRDSIIEWKKSSMYNCNYKCVITGNEFSHVHHLYSFNKIVKEFVENNKLNPDTILADYDDKELKVIVDKFIEYHDSFGLGVCLSEDVHKLYHKIYGDDNIPEQFEEFKIKYLNNEYLSFVL